MNGRSPFHSAYFTVVNKRLKCVARLSIEIIIEEVLSLPNNLKIELGEKLIESLEFNVDES